MTRGKNAGWDIEDSSLIMSEEGRFLVITITHLQQYIQVSKQFSEGFH